MKNDEHDHWVERSEEGTTLPRVGGGSVRYYVQRCVCPATRGVLVVTDEHGVSSATHGRWWVPHRCQIRKTDGLAYGAPCVLDAGHDGGCVF